MVKMRRAEAALLVLSTSVAALVWSNPALAACAPGAPGVMDCTGDPGAQAFTNPPIGQLNYFNLTNNIVAAGVSGAQLTSQPGTAGGGGLGIGPFSGGDGNTGGAGGGVNISLAAPGGGFVVDASNGIGINAVSIGGKGGTGGDNITTAIVLPPFFAFGAAGNGGNGGSGGNVVVTTTGAGLVRTTGDNAHGIRALSQGGAGGDGGDAIGLGGFIGLAGDGGVGGSPGAATVNNVLAVDTSGHGAAGIWAQSVGAAGGDGGTAGGNIGNAGGDGAASSSGGPVIVSHSGNITTRGDNALGIMAQSIGGYSGSGGGAWGLLSFGGSPASAGNGGTVTVDTFAPGRIETSGAGSYAVFAQSVGGGGGAGGPGGGLVGFGGAGGAAGGGTTVTVRNRTELVTHGPGATALVAQSVGGGGGSAGTGAGVVGIGGTSGGGGNSGLVTVENTGALRVEGNGDGAALGNYGILAQSIGGGGGSANASGGLVAIGGRGGAGGASGDVQVTNSGTIISTANCPTCRDAGAIYAQSVGGGGGHGGNTGGIFAIGGSGGGGGTSGAVTVNNSGTLETHALLSRGIFAQSIGGGGGDGGFAGGVVSIGGGGGEGGSVANPLRIGGKGNDVRANQTGQGVTVNNTGNITTTGGESHAIFAQSVGGGGGNGGGSVAVGAFLAIGIGGAGGVGGNGGVVNVNAAGIPAASDISTSGDRSAGIFAQSVGGGGGSGGFAIAAQGGIYGGLSAAFGGSGASGGGSENVTVNANGTITTRGAFAPGIYAESIGGGGGRGGFSIAAGVTVTGVQASLAFGGKGGPGGSAKDVTVNNAAAISTGEFGRDGAESHAIFASSIGGGGGSGGFSVAAGVGQYGAVNASFGGNAGSGNEGGVVKVTNSGELVTRGLQSHGILAQSIGGGGGSGGFSGALSVDLGGVGAAALAFGGEGGTGGAAKAVTVGNTSNVTTFADGSSGILAQSVGGGGGNGGFAGAISFTTQGALGAFASSVGGTAGAGSLGRDVTVTHQGDLQTFGNNATGILAQSVGGGGGTGGFSLAAGVGIQSSARSSTVGGKGGQGGEAGNVKVGKLDDRVTGAIRTSGALSHGILAQSIGGGGGNGGFAIGASFSLQDDADGNSVGGGGGTGQHANSVEVYSEANILTGAGCALDGAGCLAVGSHGIFAQSIGGGGGNGGFGIAAGVSIEGKAAASSTGGTGSGAGEGRAVTVESRGRIETRGANSYGIFAQSVGGGGGSGAFSIAGSVSINDEAQTQTVGGAGGSGGSGGTVKVTTSNEILTQGQISHGILAQSIGGGGGVGGFAIGAGFSLEGEQATNSTGGSGAGAGNGGVVTVDAGGRIETRGSNSHGVFAQSVGGGGGSGAFSIAAGVSANEAAQAQSVGGAGGAAGEGNTVDVSISRDVITRGAISHGVFAQSVGGGGGDGGFSIGASLGAESSTSSVGGSGSGGGLARKVTVGVGSEANPNVLISTSGDGSIGVLAQSIGGGGGSGGFSGGLAIALDGKAENKVGSSDKDNGGGNITAGQGGDGGEVKVDNFGFIRTTGNNAAGVFTQSVAGSGGWGGLSIGIGTGGSTGLKLGLGATGDILDALPVAGERGVVTVTIDGKTTVTDGALSYGLLSQAIGGGGGAAGNVLRGVLNMIGSDVLIDVGSNGSMNGDGTFNTSTYANDTTTTGVGSIGLIAQSIGGGGGVNNTVFDTLNLNPNGLDEFKVRVGGYKGGIGLDGGGSGGGFNLTAQGTVTTTNVNAIGIVGQSIGGGGGIGNVTIGTLGNSAANYALTLGGSQTALGNAGPASTLTAEQQVTTSGVLSHGIVGQSIGGGGGISNLVVGSAASIPGGIDIAIGSGAGGAGGNGGDVTVNAAGVATSGAGSFGIVGQSVGGGGGLAGLSVNGVVFGQSGFTPPVTLSAGTGAGGSGGKVTINADGDVRTAGYGAHGIVGQSVGGGGGIVGVGRFSPTLGTQAFAGSRGGGGAGGDVEINTTRNVIANDSDTFGIYGGSAGTGANGRIVVDVRNSGNGVGLIWGGAGQGAAVMLDGGSNNVLASDGTIYANGNTAPPPGLAQISGMAVLGTTGNDAVLNVAYTPPAAPPAPQGFGSDYGVAFTTSSGVDPVTGLPIFNIGTRTSNIVGNIDLGAGQNSITNQSNALIISEAFIRLDDDATPNASQTLLNRGLLSPGDRARVQETAVAGNFNQTVDGTYFIDIDLNAQNTASPVNDRLNLTGNATAGGEGSLLLTSINKKFTEYTIIDAPAAGSLVINTGFTPTIEPGVVGFNFMTRVDPSGAGQALILFAEKPALSDLLMDPASGVTDPNVYRMGDGIDAIDQAIGVDDPFNYLVNLLRLSPDVKTLGDAVASLTPSNAPHVFEIMHRRGTAFLEASAECPFGYRGAGPADKRNCVWAKGSYGEYERDSVQGSPINNDSWHALTMGGQAAIDPNWQIGFGLEKAMINSRQTRNGEMLSSLESDYYQGSLTATYRNGPFRVGVVASASRGAFESKRKVNVEGFSQDYTSFDGIVAETPIFSGKSTEFEGISGTAKSKGDATGFSQLLRFAYVQPLGSGFDATPFLDLENHILRTQKRTETGVGLANLTFPSVTEHAFTITPGVELGYIGRMQEDTSARVYVRGGVRFAPDNVWTAKTQFVAAPGGLPSIKIKDRFDDTVLKVDAGITLFNSAGFELDMSYSGAFGESTREDEVRGGVTYRF